MARRKTNKIAYSEMLKSYIKCIEFKGSMDWKFVKCDKDGNVTDSIVRKGTTYYSMFKWADCES